MVEVLRSLTKVKVHKFTISNQVKGQKYYQQNFLKASKVKVVLQESGFCDHLLSYITLLDVNTDALMLLKPVKVELFLNSLYTILYLVPACGHRIHLSCCWWWLAGEKRSRRRTKNNVLQVFIHFLDFSLISTCLHWTEKFKRGGVSLRRVHASLYKTAAKYRFSDYLLINFPSNTGLATWIDLVMAINILTLRYGKVTQCSRCPFMLFLRNWNKHSSNMKRLNDNFALLINPW